MTKLLDIIGSLVNKYGLPTPHHILCYSPIRRPELPRARADPQIPHLQHHCKTPKGARNPHTHQYPKALRTSTNRIPSMPPQNPHTPPYPSTQFSTLPIGKGRILHSYRLAGRDTLNLSMSIPTPIPRTNQNPYTASTTGREPHNRSPLPF